MQSVNDSAYVTIGGAVRAQYKRLHPDDDIMRLLAATSDLALGRSIVSRAENPVVFNDGTQIHWAIKPSAIPEAEISVTQPA